MEFVQEDVTTLHDFGNADPTVDLDSVGVVVPVGGEDAVGASVRRTLRTVATHDPGTLVVPVRGERDAVTRIRSLLDERPVDATVLWCNGPGTTELLTTRSIEATGSKGLDVWLGVLLASEHHDIVAVHDADATSYSPDHLPRLIWPVERGYSFAKAYYARVERDRLYGRLTRLFWMPLIATIDDRYDAKIVDYLRAFRYPLAGEFAASADLLRSVRLPRGFGLEVGVLGEAFAITGGQETAQVDLGWHRHDHRPVTGPGGLVPMARSIAGTLDAVLSAAGLHIDLDELRNPYRKRAETFIERYADDAAFNGLRYDVTDERDQADRYAAALADTDAPSWLPPIRDADLRVDDLLAVGAVDPRGAIDARGEAD